MPSLRTAGPRNMEAPVNTPYVAVNELGKASKSFSKSTSVSKEWMALAIELANLISNTEPVTDFGYACDIINTTGKEAL